MTHARKNFRRVVQWTMSTDQKNLLIRMSHPKSIYAIFLSFLKRVTVCSAEEIFAESEVQTGVLKMLK